MDASAKNELNSIIRELGSIISALDNVSNGIRRDFKNIGNDKCADCIDRVTSYYRSAKRDLSNIDTSK